MRKINETRLKYLLDKLIVLKRATYDYQEYSGTIFLPDCARDIDEGRELGSAGNANDRRSVKVDQLRRLVHGCAGASNGLARFVVSTCQNFAGV